VVTSRNARRMKRRTISLAVGGVYNEDVVRPMEGEGGGRQLCGQILLFLSCFISLEGLRKWAPKDLGDAAFKFKRDYSTKS